MENIHQKLTNAIMACLFAALISIGAYIAIPIPGTPVPIVLQNMFIILAALIIGPWWGLAAVVFYLLLGAVGMPVFSGGTGGLVKFAGPTGGYLVGYIPAVVVMGFLSKLGNSRWYFNILAGFAGMAIVYLFGVARLKAVLQLDWAKALATGLVPFIPGDIAKIVFSGILAPSILKAIHQIEQQSTNA